MSMNWKHLPEEISQHLQDVYDDLRARGASDETARRAVAAEIEGANFTRRPFADVGGDLRYAGRALRRYPGFAAVVILTLALGIGANAAIFSVVDAVVLRPLPYDRDGRLVAVWGNLHKPGLEEIPGSAAEFVDYRERNRVFDAIAAYDTRGVNLTGFEQPERVPAAVTTASLFSILGESPALGRSFVAADEQPGRNHVVIVSHSLWQRRLGGDPNVIGRTIAVDGTNMDIVGVMRAGFTFPDDVNELWQPLAFTAEDISDDQRGSHSYTIIGRLKPGVTVTRARAGMKTLGEQMGAEHRTVYRSGFSASVRPLHDELVGNVGPALFVLLAAVGVVLVIACANVANLLLARAAARQKEIAIRAALGAGRMRIMRQLLTESVLLGLCGGALGLLLAVWGVHGLVALAPPSIPRLNEIGVDGRVVSLTSLVSMLTGVLFGLVPALHASRHDVHETLKDGTRTSADGGTRGRVRRALVISEVALSLVLLIAAGLLINSFARVQDVHPGFNPDHVLTARLALPSSKYTTLEQGQRFAGDLLARLAQTHGVVAAAAINAVPFSGRGGDRSFFVEGRPVAPGEPSPDEQVRFATAGYFTAMQIPMVRGREFTERDVDTAVHVAVANDAFARKYWPNENAIGKRVQFQQETTNRYEIVGVAGNVRHRALDATEKPELYVPIFQPLFEGFRMPPMDLVVRTASDPALFAPALREIVTALDRDQPISDIKTMDQRIGQSLASRRFNMLLLGLFAALALVLAAVGIYGVVAYTVTERTHEIGVRLALGAQPRDVLAMLVGQGMTLAAAGAVIGIVIAIALTRAMTGLLFGVSATDPVTFGVITAVLALVALFACYLPARRATGVNPVTALRNE
jgi:putative ABC transport system permease protein